MTFEELQKLKDLKKRCEENLKGEPVIVQAENDLHKIETTISKLENDLKPFYTKQAELKQITKGRAGLENSKIILSTINADIDKLQKQLKKE